MKDHRHALRLASLLLAVAFSACSSAPSAPAETVTPETRSPLADPAAAAAAGKPLFATHCANCHGDTGRGDGIASMSLPARPTDLATLSLSEGAVFLVLKNGKMVNGKFTMPPTKRVSDEQLWQLVAYLQTLAAK